MKPERPSYIGITDFENYEQVQRILEFFTKLVGTSNARKLMVGLMMNYQTLHKLDTVWANSWPTREKIGEMFRPHPKAFNTLHYADYKQGRTTAKDLAMAIEFADSHKGLDALQLDMPWPNPDVIINGVQNFIRSGRSLPVVIMLGSTAAMRCEYDMNRTIERIGDYKDIVDYVLVDFSAGKGIPMDVDLTRKYLRALVDTYGNKFSYTIAGGFGAGQMHIPQPLLVEFPGLNCDAQGRMHIDNDPKKPSDPEKQEAYLVDAVRVFK
jgi:hypothetical protein